MYLPAWWGLFLNPSTAINIKILHSTDRIKMDPSPSSSFVWHRLSAFGTMAAAMRVARTA